MNSREAEERLKYMLKRCDGDGFCKYYLKERTCDGCCEAVRIATKKMEQEEQRCWIPVSERMPENENGKYLVTIEYEHLCGRDVCIRIMGYCAGKKEWYRTTTEEWIETGQITAWMPLPDPYQKDKQRGGAI